MTRVGLAQPRGLDPVRRAVYAYARRLYGRPLQPTMAIGNHLPLLVGYGAVSLAADRYARSVKRRLKELAMLRTAQLIGCEWCLDFGSRLAHEAGIPEADLRELALWQSSDRFDELDRLVLEYAEAMTRTPVEVPDELFTRLRDQFDDRQLVELTMAIALENLYSRSNWALGIEGEGLSEGMYCVAAEQRPPDSVVANPAPR